MWVRRATRPRIGTKSRLLVAVDHLRRRWCSSPRACLTPEAGLPVGFPADPSMRNCELAMTIYDERPWHSLYDEGVPTTVDLPYPNCLAMFDAAVEANPDAPLIHYFDTTLSMADVDRKSAALAVGLAEECGLQRGDRVAVQLQNVPTFVLSMLAVWRLGAIMIPINPMYKQELTGLLRDSGAK